ncbi:MAG: hypothetical protein MR630_09480 [Selenomonas sp.]|uniref:hypothetical protein n=1 Tax=Selenomonas sp. TaxID=2053611 RepID=UPI0025F43F68|nr:hypothetical protein [Selenomonas sp.]MCI6232823.1 hypothetical protein [Selenomonas sp.]
MELTLSTLPKTWLFDIDGTLVKHNGYKEGGDVLLPGVAGFFSKLPPEDAVILLTARPEASREETEQFLQKNGIRYDKILFGLPTGERILVNDDKPSGLSMGHAVRKDRDAPLSIDVRIDPAL